jgi:hypothetical protein
MRVFHQERGEPAVGELAGDPCRRLEYREHRVDTLDR